MGNMLNKPLLNDVIHVKEGDLHLYILCPQIEMVHHLALLKSAAAWVNKQFGLEERIADAICTAAKDVR